MREAVSTIGPHLQTDIAQGPLISSLLQIQFRVASLVISLFKVGPCATAK